jgi:hypothetical protein
MCYSVTYHRWQSMIQRCYDKNRSGYDRYGGRGISVCERWRQSFSEFLLDMGEVPFKGASLDRINTNGNYEPANCRWATMREQQNNKSTNHLVVLNGETKTISELATQIGMNYFHLYRRLRNGFTVEQAISYKKWAKRPKARHIPDDQLVSLRGQG